MREKLRPIEEMAAHDAGPSMSQPSMTTCEVCGQQFDMRSLEQAHHHSHEPHAPLEN